jgi:hypothetical protein
MALMQLHNSLESTSVKICGLGLNINVPSTFVHNLLRVVSITCFVLIRKFQIHNYEIRIVYRPFHAISYYAGFLSPHRIIVKKPSSFEA